MIFGKGDWCIYCQSGSQQRYRYIWFILVTLLSGALAAFSGADAADNAGGHRYEKAPATVIKADPKVGFQS